MSEAIQWAKLTPEERDRFVAEKVMGWDPNAPCTGQWVAMDPEPDGLYCTGCGAEIGWGTKNWDDYHDQPRAKAYTQSMDLAWEVIECGKFMDVQITYSESWKNETEKSRIYDCSIAAYSMPHRIAAFGTTPMEAICIASLRACGVEIAE